MQTDNFAKYPRKPQRDGEKDQFVQFVQVRDSMSLVWNPILKKFLLEESIPANLVILWLLSHSVWEITLKGFLGFTIAVILTMSVKHLEIHKKNKHEEKRFKCPQCDYQATQKGNKAIHKEAVHDGVIITIECKVFLGVFLVIFELGSRSYIVKSVTLIFWVIFWLFLHEITLLAIDMDNIGCLEPILPL